MTPDRDVPFHQKGSRIIDLFAGPGGWSEGLRMLGHSEIGIEWDESACTTARTAGHERLLVDVAALDPSAFAPCWGLIGSPPCPTFSMAGNGAGRRDMEHVIACAQELAAGIDRRSACRGACDDERSMLVVEPLRWALELRPEWIALEQVPPVLDLWEMFGHMLERRGYSVWAGVLECERYGVPQTRERAVLMASRVRAVHPPRPTHQRYVPGEPRRHAVSFDGETLPWVSMADAIGWGMTERPCVTVTAGSGRQGGPDPLDGGSGARATVRAERAAGRWGAKPLGSGSGAARTLRSAAAAGTFTEPERLSPRGSAKVSEQEAGVLQGFRPDYPWSGERAADRYRQIGNAVPPLLARAVLAELAGEALEEAA